MGTTFGIGCVTLHDCEAASMGRIHDTVYSRGIPFPGSHCGENRPSLSSAVHIVSGRVGEDERLSSGEKTRMKAFLTS